MKKIVHIITGLNTGGAEMMLYKLLVNMDKNAYYSAVVSLGDKGTIGPHIESLGIPVYTLKLTGASKIVSAIMRLGKVIRKESPDIVQGWMYHGNFISVLIKFFIKKNILLVWNIRYSLYDIALEKLNTRFIIKLCAALSRIPDATIYNSKIATVQHQKSGYSLSRHQVIPNGFDSQIFQPSATFRQAIRQELNIGNEDIVVGHVARFHPMKGHDILFDAILLLYDKYPRVHYVLSGRGVCCSTEEFRRFLTRVPVSNRIHLLGERQDIPALTSSFDLAVSSSSWGEGFSNTIGEAMASAVPCVVTDVGDSAWIVGDGGMVVPPSQPKALAAAIEKGVLLDSNQRKTLGAKGRSRIEKHFSIREIVNQYKSLYDDIVSKTSARHVI
jgi:glycosyltransferase involved in cell wall biosynthesis